MTPIESRIGGKLEFVAQVRRWIQSMAADPRQRCILHNLFSREIEFQHFPREEYPQFVDRLGKLIQTVSLNGETSPSTFLEKLVKDHLVVGKERELLFRGPAIFTSNECLSRVMSVADLNVYHLRNLGKPISQSAHEEIADEIQHGDITAKHLDAGSRWEGKYPMCWVTKSESLKSLGNASSSALATKVRDASGKLDWGKGEHLVEIQYPQDLPVELKAPTVLDSGACGYFRLHHEADGWGRAVDLSTLDHGIPEALHLALPVSANFRLRYLGKIDEDAVDLPYDNLLLRSKEQLRQSRSRGEQ